MCFLLPAKASLKYIVVATVKQTVAAASDQWIRMFTATPIRCISFMLMLQFGSNSSHSFSQFS